jgi:hypothetical protein
MWLCHIESPFYNCSIWYVVMCTQFVYVVKYISIGHLYSYVIELDLFYIWKLYRQILISGTNQDMNINMNLQQQC